MPASIWLEWFRLAAYHRPDGPLTVYRGARPRYVRALSWTTDRNRADWFASRWQTTTGDETHVYEAVASPAAVLADIDALNEGGRAEHEVVVEPSLLEKVQRLR